MFMVVGLIILGIAVLLSVGVFAYARFLGSESASKAAELKQAQNSVSEDTVNSFLRLKNRLTSAQTILADHVTLSQFFNTLESLTLQNVRLSSLTLTVADDHSADVKITGTAKDFNTLAAQSAAFTAQPLIHQAIFSGITADNTGVVTFSLEAPPDPQLVNFSSGVPASCVASSPASSTKP